MLVIDLILKNRKMLHLASNVEKIKMEHFNNIDLIDVLHVQMEIISGYQNYSELISTP